MSIFGSGLCPCGRAWSARPVPAGRFPRGAPAFGGELRNARAERCFVGTGHAGRMHGERLNDRIAPGLDPDTRRQMLVQLQDVAFLTRARLPNAFAYQRLLSAS